MAAPLLGRRDIEVDPAALATAIHALARTEFSLHDRRSGSMPMGPAPLFAMPPRTRSDAVHVADYVAAGVYGLSLAGHDRHGSFPAATEDDRLVDHLFAPGRRRIWSGLQ